MSRRSGRCRQVLRACAWAVTFAVFGPGGCTGMKGPPDAQSGTARASHHEPFGLVEWTFATYRQAGGRIVEGLLTIPDPIRPNVRFYGSWHASYVGPPELESSFGPQSRGGKLMGQFNPSGELVLQLNPSMNNHNVNLIGRLEGDHYAGRWAFADASGVLNEGTFSANRVRKQGE